jgi:4-hydroxybenzoate polyprenyltransferase
MINQVILDTKDIESDKKRALLTLPVICGMSRVILILRIYSLISTLLLVYVATSLGLNAVIVYLVIASLIINIFAAYMVKDRRKIGHIVVASKFFFWFLIILILK